MFFYLRCVYETDRYEALGGTNGQITKAELAAKKEFNLSNKNLTDTDEEYLKDATGCEKLDLSNNINVKKIDALKMCIRDSR